MVSYPLSRNSLRGGTRRRCQPELLLVGASHTAGTVHPAGDGPPFATLLRSQLTGWRMHNLGVGAASASAWRASAPPHGGRRLHRELLLPRPPSLALVTLGPNDTTLSFIFGMTQAVAVSWFRQQMLGLLAEMLSLGHRPVVPTPPPFPSGDGRAARLGVLADEVLRALDVQGVALGPDLHAVVDDSEHYTDGNQHMNALGHAAVSEAWVDWFRSTGQEP